MDHMPIGNFVQSETRVTGAKPYDDEAEVQAVIAVNRRHGRELTREQAIEALGDEHPCARIERLLDGEAS